MAKTRSGGDYGGGGSRTKMITGTGDKKKKEKGRLDGGRAVKKTKKKVKRIPVEKDAVAKRTRTRARGVWWDYKRRRTPFQLPEGGQLTFDDYDDHIRAGPEIQKRLYALLNPADTTLGRRICGYCKRTVFSRKRGVGQKSAVFCGCYKATSYCSEDCRAQDVLNGDSVSREGHKCSERDNVKKVVSRGSRGLQYSTSSNIRKIYPLVSRYVTTRDVRENEILSTPTEQPLLFCPSMDFKQVQVKVDPRKVGCQLSCAGCLRLLAMPVGVREKCRIEFVYLGVIDELFTKYKFNNECVQIYERWECKGCRWLFCSSLCAKGVMHPAKECRLLRILTNVHGKHPLSSGTGVYPALWWIPIVRILLMKDSLDATERQRYTRFWELPANREELPQRQQNVWYLFESVFRDTMAKFIADDGKNVVSDIITRFLLYGFKLQWIQNLRSELGFVGVSLYPFRLQSCIPNSEFLMKPTSFEIIQKASTSIASETFLTFSPKYANTFNLINNYLPIGSEGNEKYIEDPFHVPVECRCERCVESRASSMNSSVSS